MSTALYQLIMKICHNYLRRTALQLATTPMVLQLPTALDDCIGLLVAPQHEMTDLEAKETTTDSKLEPTVNQLIELL